VLLTVTSFALQYVWVGGIHGVHGKLGVAAVGVVILQMLMGAFRNVISGKRSESSHSIPVSQNVDDIEEMLITDHSNDKGPRCVSVPFIEYNCWVVCVNIFIKILYLEYQCHLLV
jgi:hypothetical protein